MKKRDAVDRTHTPDLQTKALEAFGMAGIRKRKSLCDLTPTDIVHVLHTVNVDLLTY